METIQLRLNRQWKQILCCTVFFVLITHGYRYVQTSFTHDSIAFASGSDLAWKISLGRFMQPVYWLLRGKIAAPFIVGLFTILWLIPAIYYTAQILNISSTTGTWILCGVLCGSLTLVSANASYVHEADTYMLAMLLNILAAKLSLKDKPLHWIAAVLLVAAAAGLYQAFAQIYAALIMLWAVRILIAEEAPVKAVWLRSIRSAALMILGIGVYLLLNALVQTATGITPESGYNGLTTIGEYADENLLKLAVWTWLYPIYYYLRVLPGKVSPFYALVHFLVLAYAGVMTLYILKQRKCKPSVWLSVLGILALLPVGMNCMYPISKGLVHDLILCAYSFGQIYAIMITEYACGIFPKDPNRKASAFLLHRLLPLLLCILFVSKAIWANQEYLKKDLEADSSRAVIIRVLDRVEQLEGFEPGVTPVHFIGILDDSPLVAERPPFKPHSALTGSWFASALTFGDDYWTFWSYFEDVLGYPIVPYTAPLTPQQTEAAEQMHPFPAQDSVQLVDGVALIKFS